jgi:hypothetical protein
VWVVLRDPAGKGPDLSFQARDRRPDRRSWLHLDLYTSQRDGEVERLVRLGARSHPWRYGPHADFVVLEDRAARSSASFRSSLRRERPRGARPVT